MNKFDAAVADAVPEAVDAFRTKAGDYPVYTTPVGTLVYPNLNVPRDFNGDGRFAYDTNLVLDGEEAEQLKDLVDAGREASEKKFKTGAQLKPCYGPHIVKDSESGEEEEVPGALRFRFKVQAVTKTKKGREWDRQPELFDSKGSPVNPDKAIVGSGTKARIAFQLYPWKNPSGSGLTLQPMAVMIYDFVEGRTQRGGDAGAYGFESDGEGSFSASSFDDDDGEPAGDGETGAADGGDF